jgi:hypothetical protein
MLNSAPHTGWRLEEPTHAFGSLLNAVLDMTRWRILNEVLKGEALPVLELSKRLGVQSTNLGKHCAVLLRLGMLKRGYDSSLKLSRYAFSRSALQRRL